MKQSKLIKIVDLCSFISLTLIVSTGTLLEFTLPARTGKSTVWGMTRYEWGEIHLYISVVFLVMMSLHMLTHLKYIKQALSGTASTEHKYRIGIGLIGVIILLVPVMSPVTEGDRFGQGYGAKHRQ